MIVASWGFMIGVSTLLIIIGTIIGMLGGDFHFVLFGCLLVGTTSLLLILPVLKNEYYLPKAKTLGEVVKFFFAATLNGFGAPLWLLYQIIEIAVKRQILIKRVHRLNKRIYQTHVLNAESHERIRTLKRQNQDMARKMPRGNTQVTVLQRQIDKLFEDNRERNSTLLRAREECIQIAAELGTKLREYDTHIEIEYAPSLAYLISAQISRAYIPGANGVALRTASQ